MAIERINIDWQMNALSRSEQRIAVLMKWTEEKAGDIGVKQSYRYNVEKFSNDGIVYLNRPAFKNKGCDFVVNCEPLIPRPDGKQLKNPRHNDLIDELQSLVEQNPSLKNEIIGSLFDVYECKNVNNVAQRILLSILDSTTSMRVERALKVLKWLFIEQDITDWNTSGRKMLMNSIKQRLIID